MEQKRAATSVPARFWHRGRADPLALAVLGYEILESFDNKSLHSDPEFAAQGVKFTPRRHGHVRAHKPRALASLGPRGAGRRGLARRGRVRSAPGGMVGVQLQFRALSHDGELPAFRRMSVSVYTST